ncbi:MAG TPA: membrane-bound PQQ-dependent dehydrogenase, glucose/quinate/shikimate family [Dongiaceae bacterium]|nr:membrane-bound PQQ-dependent dehydrogenase, glucose/quinate/shikimate family [Dongiaceae bacterium]
MWNRVFNGFLVFTSLALIGFGAELVFLGGSLYYLAAGLIIGVVAYLSIIRSTRALFVYAVFYIATLVWALWESGLDGWALTPRLAMFTVLGLWMLLPPYRRSIGLPPNFRGSSAFWSGLTIILIGSLVTIFYADRVPEHNNGAVAYADPENPALGEWRYYGNSQGGMRYSPLTQITPDNVGLLKPVWTYHAGTLGYEPESMFDGILTIEATPLKIGERLYLCTGYNDVIALDAETGKEIWRHHARLDAKGVFTRTCRGVAYYQIPNATGICSHRIYTATLDARLISLDADTGKPCADFGVAGEVDLREGMGVVDKGYYYVTSPPTVVRGRLVLGGWVMDGQHTDEPPGVIRAFDAVSGKFSWAFDIGNPNEHGLPPEGKTFTRGTPNSWAVMSADEELGLVYAPTGNATPDYFGAQRSANDEKYSSSVVAINAETGELTWSFQTTHHDLWDYDVASQPVLIDLPDGTKGLLQPTKRGEIFFLDRTNGKPVAEVKELPVPQGAAAGDWTSPTQPFSTGMPSFAGPRPSEKTLWGLTPIDQVYCRVKFLRARFEGTLTPVGVDRPTVTWPGYLGGINWGSVSVDPINQLMIVNSTHVMMYNQLIPRDEADARGIKPISSATGGKGEGIGLQAAQMGTPYAISSGPFLSLLAVPCQEPPFGLISGVDLKTRKLLWQKPFGTARDSGPVLLRSYLPIPMGVPNLGGSVTTASGLTFIGATQERMLRAYNSRTGEELWKTRLPAGGHATPATYWSDKSHRQFVVIAAGGHGAMLSGRSDAILAFALPEKDAAK